MENASVYMATGEVPYPAYYKNTKAKCVELITEAVQQKDLSFKFQYTVVL